MSDPILDIQAEIAAIFREARVPRATYRLQFNADFTFEHAAALIDYLHELGISDVYTSPLFRPRSGSTHGYDTVDYNQFNPVLGGPEGFDVLTQALQERQMGLLLDIVPNHMGVNTENAWWFDVLKHGPSSRYAHYFDIDWRPINRALDDKVLLPVLGDHYGRILESGELKLVYWHGDFYLHYYEHQFPLTPESYVTILRQAHEALGEVDEWVHLELLSIITALEHLPPYRIQLDSALQTRRREQTVVRWRLLGLFDNNEAFREAIQRALEHLNGTPDDPTSFDTLDDILSGQPYRLSYWRVAADEINYRRFFDINDMAAIRIEDFDVFEDSHRLALRLLAEGKASGLRIDHPDGLWNPPAYFLRLQEEYILARLALRMEGGEAQRSVINDQLREMSAIQSHASDWPLYVLAEKILSETEPLPYTWAVYGTTGYDFMTAVNNLFVNSDNEAAFDALYEEFLGESVPTFADLTDRTKKLVMSEALTSEIDARSAELARIVEQNRRYRGFTRNSIAYGLSEIIAGLPIYRTYITGPADITERDRQYIENAVHKAKRRNPLTPTGLFDFLRDTLLMANLQDFQETDRARLREFVMKFQQITGPVMAKSVEDTAFYIYNRLVSLNEVGGHPEQFGAPVTAFHQRNTERAFPHTMLATSTHDTKRSEDVRARINVLSEMPDEWRRVILLWREINAPARTYLEGEAAPALNDEYLLYQTLLGAYPDEADDLDAFIERIIAYMHKAVNEAKVNSNWINQNGPYLQAIDHFVRHILHDEAFRAAFLPFQERVAFFGRFNSLAQVTLKLTSPGMPDLYQGNELWDFSLVDPDNRRPVDFDKRRSLLADLIERGDTDRLQLARDLTADLTQGALKLYLTQRVLRFRGEHETLFREGDYLALSAAGAKAEHLCAFLRVAELDNNEADVMLVMVPRLTLGLTGGEMRHPQGETVWGDTHLVLPDALPPLENILTGQTLALTDADGQTHVTLADALSDFPVGVYHTRLTRS